MDRYLEKTERKYSLFSEFSYLDLIPYSIALLLLLGEAYILYQFIHLFGKVQY